MTRLIAIGSVLVLLVVGCNQQTSPSQDHAASTTAVSFNTAGAPTVAFNAPDLMCPEGCGAKVKEILSEQPGVQDVIVDFDSKTATVAIGGSAPFDANAAVAALVDHGFKNSSVKSGAAASQSAPSSTEKVKDGGAG